MVTAGRRSAARRGGEPARRGPSRTGRSETADAARELKSLGGPSRVGNGLKAGLHAKLRMALA